MWAWLYVAVAHFIAHTLDGIDGKQARRTNSSSPLGQLITTAINAIIKNKSVIIVFKNCVCYNYNSKYNFAQVQ